MTDEPNLEDEATLYRKYGMTGRFWFPDTGNDKTDVMQTLIWEGERVEEILQEAVEDWESADHKELASRATQKRLADPAAKRGGRAIGYSGDDKFCDPVIVGRQFLTLATELGNQNEAARRVYRDQEGSDPPEGEALRSYKRKLQRWAKGA